MSNFKILKNIFFSILLVSISVVFTSIYWKSKLSLSSSQNSSPQQVAQKAVDFLNNNLLREKKAILISAQEESGLYKAKIKIEDEEYSFFLTKDGKILFPEGAGIFLDQPLFPRAPQNPPPKRERVDVKLFVMSYCPFGIQMQKAILPVWELLKEKIDFGIYFVDYVMHGKKELEENLRQYCLQKEENEKYLSYLKCFVQKGDSEKCEKEIIVDQEKLKACMEATDKEFKISEQFKENEISPFLVHTELNKKYGVRGSPTLIVNDTLVEPKRSPESIKNIICESFIQSPPECQQKLSDEVASPGFGEGKGRVEGSCE